MKKPKLIKISWKDPAGISDEWLTIKELIEKAEKRDKISCSTVGWLLYENKNYIIIAATCDNKIEEPNYHDTSMIFKKLITKRENF